MKKLITSLLCIIAFATSSNATIYYVDGGNGNDANTGLSWSTAKKTIGSAHSLATSGDNIYIKAGIYSYTNSTYGTSALSLKADVNYYGGFDGLDSETPETRPTSDIDGNGIVEPWEFSNPTILNFTLTNGAAGLTSNISNTIVCSVNGFKITGSSQFDATCTTSRCIALYSNMHFENNTISNWHLTGVFGGVFMKAPFFGVESGINNVTVNSCLFEKNIISITGTPTDYNIDPFIRLGAANAIRRNIMSNCIVRNNQVTVDYSSSTATASNVRGMLIAMVAQTVDGYPTTLKNCVIHNNNMTYVPNATGAFAGNAAAIYMFHAATNFKDSVINCTIANNKALNMSNGGLTVRFSNATQPYHIALNNVCYNNTKDGVISNLLSSQSSPSGSMLIANNLTNGGGVENYSTTIVNNITDLADSNIDPTKGAFFTSPTTIIGYTSNGTVETSNWTIGATSYLRGKGIATLSPRDKSGNLFSNPRSVGAYEYSPLSGINEIPLINNVVSIIQNPITNGELHIQCPCFEMGEDITLSVLDLTARVLYEDKIVNSNDIIVYPHLKSGLFIIQVQNNKFRAVAKFIVK